MYFVEYIHNNVNGNESNMVELSDHCLLDFAVVHGDEHSVELLGNYNAERLDVVFSHLILNSIRMPELINTFIANYADVQINAKL